MPGAINARSASPTQDDLDNLFNYDVSMDDVFKENDNALDDTTEQSRPKAPGNNLGIDEEIKIVKKRQPVPKLDEARLLSNAGIPKLRKISKDRLRFKGKGHEFSDIARLLNTYQLWLDDLYPRAKFADALIMIEKLGHKKAIQRMRREWIDEGKPRISVEEDAVDEDYDPKRTDHRNNDQENRDAAEDESEDAARPTSQHASISRAAEKPGISGVVAPDDDELDALLAEEQEMTRQLHSNDAPDDDDLEALLADEESARAERREASKASHTTMKPNKDAQSPRSSQVDDFEDEMEAMAGMDMDNPW